MGLDAVRLRAGLDAVAAREPGVAAALARAGYPEPRIRPRGYATLLRTILGQQVSVSAAQAMWARFAAAAGEPERPEALLALPEEALRACGFSRQKAAYARGLAQAVAGGALDLMALPAEDEAAIASLSRLKGIGRWSAEIYLLFAEGRGDIFPAGDLAVQVEMARVLGLEARPAERAARALAEAWRPHRGAVAIFLWHHYQTVVL
ncbi:MAG: DNA-3-methyladenine glycosylase family protein [Sphingomonadaceae bacterium]